MKGNVILSSPGALRAAPAKEPMASELVTTASHNSVLYYLHNGDNIQSDVISVNPLLKHQKKSNKLDCFHYPGC